MEMVMTEAADRLVEQALAMSPNERAAIAARLIASLDSQVDEGVELAWQGEIQRRMAETDRGEVDLIPWEEVRVRLKASSRAKD